jgi:short-subunit dehydrogenase
MQTILGANGIIGEELARELRKNYTDKQLVGRNPQKCIHTTFFLKQTYLIGKCY